MTGSSPLISVILTVYNEAEVVGASIESVQAQKDSRLRLVRNFLSAVRGQEGLYIDGGEGLRTLRVVEKLYATSEGE